MYIDSEPFPLRSCLHVFLWPFFLYTLSLIIHPLLLSLIWFEWRGTKTRYKNIESREGPSFHCQHGYCWNCWFQNYCYRRISKRFVQTQNQKFHCSLKKGINKSDSFPYSCFFLNVKTLMRNLTTNKGVLLHFLTQLKHFNWAMKLLPP